MAYGQKFKEIRRSNLLSQVEFAKQVGVSRSVISQIEIDKIKPTLEALTRISRLFSVSLDYLMLDEEPLPEKDKLSYQELSGFNLPYLDKKPNVLMEFTAESLFRGKLTDKRIKEIPYFSLRDRPHFGFRYATEDMRSKLPHLQLPIDSMGPLMAFEILDASMHQTEIVICKLTDINAIHEQQYVVIVASDKLLDGIIEKIDNRILTINTIQLPLSQIKEIWQVQLVIAQPDVHNNLKAQLKKMELLLEDLKKEDDV